MTPTEMITPNVKALKRSAEINKKKEKHPQRKIKSRHKNPFSHLNKKYYQNNKNDKLKNGNYEVEEVKTNEDNDSNEGNDSNDDYVEIDLISAQDKARLNLFDLEMKKRIPDLKDALKRYSISKSFELYKIEESFHRKFNRCNSDHQEIHSFFHLDNMESITRNSQMPTTRTGVVTEEICLDIYPTDPSKEFEQTQKTRAYEKKISNPTGTIVRADPVRQTAQRDTSNGIPTGKCLDIDSMEINQNIQSHLNTVTPRRDEELFFLGDAIDFSSDHQHHLKHGVENNYFL